MKLVFSSQIEPRPGTFNARIIDGELHLPKAFERLPPTLRIHDHERFCSMLEMNPSSFMACLSAGWHPRELFAARDELYELLREAGQPYTLAPPAPNVGFGALPPIKS